MESNCSKCGQHAELAPANLSRKTGERLFRSWCISCEKARKDLWRAANLQRHNERGYENKKKNPERWKEYRKRYREQRLLKDPEIERRYKKEYRLKNHAICCAAVSARRTRVKLQTPRWANSFFIQEAYHLAKLREEATGFKWHVDHVVPLKGRLVCGLHVENNLQVIPAVENMKKGNKVGW